MDESNWRSVIDIALISGFHPVKYQIPALSERGGAIVFTSSYVGRMLCLLGIGAYAAAEAGLIGLTQLLAAERGADGVRVNAVLPGGNLKPMAGDDADFHEVVRGFHALEPMDEPDEIARAALFLISDPGSSVTDSSLMAEIQSPKFREILETCTLPSGLPIMG